MAVSNVTSIKLAVVALALLVTATSAAHAQQGEDLREAAQNRRFNQPTLQNNEL
jgi:hypothetical protein